MDIESCNDIGIQSLLAIFRIRTESLMTSLDNKLSECTIELDEQLKHHYWISSE
jgi:hypothetical protein